MSGVKSVIHGQVTWLREEAGRWTSEWGACEREVSPPDSAWFFYPAIWPAIGRYGPFPTLQKAIRGVEDMP